MVNGMVAVGLAVGSGDGVGVAAGGGVVARPAQAVSRMKASSKRKNFFRTRSLQGRMQVFYLILKFQSTEKVL
jgi:hypothetical protein